MLSILSKIRALTAAAEADDWEDYDKKLPTLVVKIAEAYAVLGKVVSHEAITAGSPRAWRYAYQENAGSMSTKARQNMALLPQIHADGDRQVYKIKLPDLTVVREGLDSDPDEKKAAQIELGKKLLKALLPNFDVYKIKMTNDTEPLTVDAHQMPLEVLGAINIPDVGKLDLADFDARLRGSVKFLLKPSKISQNSGFREDISDHTNFVLTIEVEVTIAIPNGYLQWMTSSSADDFVPLSAWRLMSSKLQFYAGYGEGDGKTVPPRRVPHPDAISRSAKNMRDQLGIEPEAKTDANDICVVPSGKLYWVPSGDSSVSSVMNSCIAEDGTVDLKALESRHVTTDWTTDKMVMTDAEHNWHVIDLSGARPPTAASLAHLMGDEIDEDILGSMVRLCATVGVDISSYKINQLRVWAASRSIPLFWENLLDVPLDGRAEEGESEVNDKAYSIGRAFAQLYEHLVAGNLPAWLQFEVRPYAALFGVYAATMPGNRKKLGEQLAFNRMAVENKLNTLHDMPGVEGIMPHQIRVGATMSTNPKGAVLDIRAGGGKSWTMIHDVTDLLSKGKIHRPAIVMPRNLLPQFAQEMTKFTKGRLRPFMINSTVWRSFQRRLGANPNSIRQLMARQPHNTVYLIDYGWLALNGQTFKLGEDSADTYPNAALMAMLGFDYVSFDESQRAKKLSSGRTMAAAILAGAVARKDPEGGGYIRISSGTIIHNTAKDLIGQIALIQPLALGKYGQQLKTMGTITTDSHPGLWRSVDSFARRVQVTRKEWAHLLPPVIERVHPCSLTNLQRKFYDDVMKKLVKELEDDPKVKRVLKKGEPGDDSKLAKLLERKLHKLEMWLSAPDLENSDGYGVVFTNLEGITAEDLVSPKVRVMDDLIDEQSAGGSVDLGSGEVAVPPSKNKILVLCYNKVTSVHVMKHSRHKEQLLHYRAGDDAVLDKFKEDPTAMVLVADETSMQEGHNLQMCDRIIRLQTLWTPGAQEQAHARVWRPSVPDKNGVVQYPRDYIYIDWVVIEPSIEIPKMARLIGKQVENLLLQEGSDQSLQGIVNTNKGVFANVVKVSMDLDKIKNKNLQTTESLRGQFAAYRLVKQWERNEFAAANKKLRGEVEARVGRKVKVSELGPLSMQPVTSINNPELDPGDGLMGIGYVPWTEGFTGFNPTSLNLKPLSMPQTADDDPESEDSGDAEDDGGEDESEELVHVVPHDPVLTEYGPGYVDVARARSRFVTVLVPGCGTKPIRLARYSVLGAVDDVAKRALLNLLKEAGRAGRPVLQVDTRTGALTPKVNTIPEGTVVAKLNEAKRELEKEAAPPPRRGGAAPQTPLQRAQDNLRRGAAKPPRAPQTVDTRAPDEEKDDNYRDLKHTADGRHVEARRQRRGVWHVTDGRDVVVIEKFSNGWTVTPTTFGKKGTSVAMVPTRGVGFKTAKELLDKKIIKPGSADRPRTISQPKGLPVDDVQITPRAKKPIEKTPPGVIPATGPGAKKPPVKASPSPKKVGPISLMDTDEDELRDLNADIREGNAVVFNGQVCLLTDDGGLNDKALLKNGFDRIGKSAAIRVKNPKAYDALIELLKTKFVIPPGNQKALDFFGDVYRTQRANVAFAKPKELPFHNFWVKDQRKKSTDKLGIRPWPVVEDGKVYVYINIENSPGALKLRSTSLPVGVVKPVVMPPALIAMVRSGAAAKDLLKRLGTANVKFSNEAKILRELSKIRG